MAGLVRARYQPTFTPGTAPTISGFLQTALTKLRAYCNNNQLSYSRFTWQVDIDLPTGNFIFTASAYLYPNTYASITAAEAALGPETCTLLSVS